MLTVLKKYLSSLILIFTITFSIFFATSVSAEQSEQFGIYTVHYIAVNSNFINTDIAEEYGIVRGNRRAFLNISILKNESDGKTTAVNADVTGGKKNLLGQVGDIEFIRVVEGDAIYYLGQFEFSNAENIKFEVGIQPESSNERYNLEWRTKLYID